MGVIAGAKREPPHIGQRLEQIAMAWLAAVALVGTLEWALVLALDGAALPGPSKKLLLLALDLGNLAPHVLLAVVLVQAVRLGGELAAAKVGRWASVASFAGLGFVAALPYAMRLGRFTFSGPAARTMAHHGLLVAVAVVLVAGAFAGASGGLARGLLQRYRLACLAGSGVATLACLWLSRTTLANEYEPLHAFLGTWSVLFSAAFGVAGADGPRPKKAWSAPVAAALVVALVMGAAVIAGRVPGVAWVLWSKTGVSRYITTRIRWFEPVLKKDGSNAKMALKPQLENEQSAAARRKRRSAPAPNIVIFSIDGLRPDHLGAYGYRVRRTSPNIDRFAARGARFVNAFSSYPQTARFNTSLLLGRYMAEMGRKHVVPPAFQSRAVTRLLHERGYHVLTKAWFEHSSQSTFDPAAYQIDTNVKKSRSKSHLEEPLEERLPVLEAHLRAAKTAGKPAFMWMHLLGTHPVNGKFVPDPAFRFGSSRAERYDSAIAGSDRWLEHVERLMLQVGGTSRPTVWIICADHGVKVDEEGRDLYASIVRVPLIIVAPDIVPSVRREPIDTALDLAATVLDFAGIAAPESYDGISLLPLLEVGDPEGQMAIRLIPLKRGRWHGAIYGPYKLLEYGGSLSLVNADQDPTEQLNLIDEYGGLAQLMQQRANAELTRRANSLRGKRPDKTDAADADDDE